LEEVEDQPPLKMSANKLEEVEEEVTLVKVEEMSQQWEIPVEEIVLLETKVEQQTSLPGEEPRAEVGTALLRAKAMVTTKKKGSATSMTIMLKGMTRKRSMMKIPLPTTVMITMRRNRGTVRRRKEATGKGEMPAGIMIGMKETGDMGMKEGMRRTTRKDSGTTTTRVTEKARSIMKKETRAGETKGILLVQSLETFLDLPEFQNLGIPLDLLEFQNLGISLDLLEFQSLGIPLDLLEFQSLGISLDLLEFQNLGISLDLLEFQSLGISLDLLEFQNLGISLDLLEFQNLGISLDLLEFQSLGISLDLLEFQSLGIPLDLRPSLGSLTMSLKVFSPHSTKVLPWIKIQNLLQKSRRKKKLLTNLPL